MTFKRIKLHNYKSYANCELDLSDLSACTIIGKNGTGKSTIVEAIVWAIYGSSKMGNKDLVRSGSNTPCCVEVDMEIDGKLYEISREYDDGKMGLELKVDGKKVAQGSKNLSIVLTKAVGATQELLQESVVIPQGQLGSFIKSTPSQRRDLVASILGLDKYGKAWEMAKDSLREMSLAVSSRNGTIESIENQIKTIPTYEELDANIDGERKKMEEREAKIDELTAKRDKMRAEDRAARDACANLDLTVKDLTSKIANAEIQFDQQIGKIDSDIRVCTKRGLDIKNFSEMLPNLEVQLKEANDAILEMVKITKDTEDCNREIDGCRKRIAVIKEGGDVCPVCGTKVEPSKWQAIVASIEDEMRSLMGKLSKVPKMQPKGQPEVISRQIAEYREKIAKLEGQQDSTQILLTQLDGLKKQKEEVVSGLRAELATATQTLKIMGSKVNTEVAIVEDQIKSFTTSQKWSRDMIIEIASTKKNRETMENSLKDAKTNLALFKEKLPETEFVAGALSPTGIPLMITDYYMPLVAQRTQALLHQMSDGKLNVKVEVTEAGTKKGIDILAGTDTLRPIESLSGGEGTRVSLALRVALSQILQELSGCKFNCLIVDEPEYLDEDGVGQFVATVNTLRDQYQQIFCISHIDSIKHSLPNAIMVTKENEVSDARVI